MSVARVAACAGVVAWLGVAPAGAQSTSSTVAAPETIRQHLERRIDVIQHREAEIKAFIDTDFALARREADRLAELNGSGDLYGMVIAVKDNIGVAGFRTTAGTRALATTPKVGPAAGDAAVVASLRREGAIIVGTTNMDTWARGVRGISEVRGQTANPLDPTRNAGGSSAGSAAAVAAGMVDLAIGTDTCGSIRYPASSVGIYGLKPTWGSVSLSGVVPLAPGQDVVGPLAADVRTLRSGWKALGGEVRLNPPVAMRLGVVSGMGVLDPAWVKRAEAAGFRVVSVGPAPSTAGVNLIEVQFPVAQRAYIGWRKGTGAASWITPSGLIGSASQQKAQRAISARRGVLAANVTRVLDHYSLDALVYPANRGLPAPLGAVQPSGNCMLASGSGLPAIAVPGVVPGGSTLSVGVELIGRPNSEDVLLAVAGHLSVTHLSS